MLYSYRKGYQERYVVQTGGKVGVNCTHTTIAAALTDAATSGNPTQIYVRNGTYSESLTIGSNNVTIIGENNNNTIITNASSSDILSINGYSNVRISNIQFKKTGVGGNGYILAIEGGNCDNIMIDNCYFISAGTDGTTNTLVLAIVAAASQTITNVIFDSNYILLSGTGKAEAITILAYSAGTSKIQHVNITNNIIRNTAAAAGGGAWGGLINGTSNNNSNCIVEYINITGNNIYNEVSGYGNMFNFDINAADTGIFRRSVISGNIFWNVTEGVDSGLRFDKGNGTLDGISVVGNTIGADVGSHVIQVASPTNITDSGNTKLTS